MYGRRNMFNINGDAIGAGIVRLGLAGGACAGWYVSFLFSVMGFQAWNSNPIMTRLAYCTVFFFTALQLWVNHQNRDDPNYGLAISGIVSYGFGIITNVMGILTLGGTSLAIAWQTGQWWQIGLALSLGIPLEIGPESLLMKALFPNSRNMVSDALAGLWNVIRGVSQGVSEGIADERPAVSTMRSRGGGSSRREELEKQFYQPHQTTPTQNQPVIRSTPRPQNPPAKQDPEYHDLGDY